MSFTVMYEGEAILAEYEIRYSTLPNGMPDTETTLVLTNSRGYREYVDHISELPEALRLLKSAMAPVTSE